MFQSYTHGYALRLYLHLCFCQIAIDVTCGMPRCQYHRTTIGLFRAVHKVYGFHACHLVAFYHLGLEVHLSSASQYCFSHILYHLRQFVRADMGMSVGKDSRGGTVLAEYVKNFLRAATLL